LTRRACSTAQRQPRHAALPRRPEPAPRRTVPVGVVPWTGVVLRAPTVVVDVRTVIVGARIVTRPRRSFGSCSSVTHGCLPAGDNCAAPELVDKSSIDETLSYEQLHAARPTSVLSCLRERSVTAKRPVYSYGSKFARETTRCACAA